jgi:hypothetical protein
MPRNNLSKEEIKIRILKLRRDVDTGLIGNNWSEYQRNAAQEVLNSALNIIDEYRY